MRLFLTCLFSFLLASPVLAQEEMTGLDLSEPSTTPEFQPSLGLVGVHSTDDDPIQTKRASMIEQELVKQAQGSRQFSIVVPPSKISSLLGASVHQALRCSTGTCLKPFADTAKVQRLFVGVVEKYGAGSRLQLTGFAPNSKEPITLSVESADNKEKAMIGGLSGIVGKSQAQKDRDFLRKISSDVVPFFKKLSVPNGKLRVDCIETTAVTTLNGTAVGTGTFDLYLTPGKYTVKTTAAGYLPYEKSITLASGKTAEVKVALAAKPLDAIAIEKSTPGSGNAFYKKPGLYLAVAGLAAIATGAYFGSHAKSLERKAVDTNGDGFVDITRAQAQTAKSEAMMANILFGVGGAATLGGGIWFFVSPSGKAKAKGDLAPVDEVPENASGVTLGFGGNF